MVSASVGFQCPTCVKEGNAGVRQARTTYGGLIPSRQSGWSISAILVAINVGIWLLIQVTGGTASAVTDWLALLPRSLCEVPGGLAAVSHDTCVAGGGDHWYRGVADGAVWRMVTSMFTQVGLMHLFFNAYNIWVLGPQLEALLGRARFLAVFGLSGLCGSVAVYWFGGEYQFTIGASGAVFGLLGALLVVVLKTRQSPQGLLFWIGLSVVFSFIAPNVSWQAHLGGLAGGALLTAALIWTPRGPRRAQLQWSAMGAVAAILVVLTIVRTAVLT